MKGLWTKNEVNYNDLKAIEVPAETNSYVPIPYNEYVDTITNMGEEHLNGFQLKNTKYGLARHNQQMFGIHTYQNSQTDIGLSVGFRTSYNKTLVNALAIGGEVFVCENLMITGNIMVMRKHTVNVRVDLESMIVDGFKEAHDDYDKVLQRREAYRSRQCLLDEGYQILGLLYGKKILSPRQLNTAVEELRNPSHKEHGKHTMWSLYNACTESLKTTPVTRMLENHKKLDTVIDGYIYA